MKSIVICVGVATLSFACSPESTTPRESESPTATDSADAAQVSTGRVEIPAAVRANLGITFAPVEARRVAQTLRLPGSFELTPTARREHRMELPGRVQLAVEELEAVEPGTLLFRFQSPAWPELQHEILVGEQAIAAGEAELEVSRARVLEVEQQLEVARARAAGLAQADFKRADLDAEIAALAGSLPRLEAEVRLAKVRLENAHRTREHALHRAAIATGLEEETLDAPRGSAGTALPTYRTLDWLEVRAERAGVVEHLEATDGAFVEPPAVVLTTVDPQRVRFRGLALQGDLPRLSESAPARIVPPSSGAETLGVDVDATVRLGLEAHPKERTLTVFAVPRTTATWIRPGVAAFLELVTDETARPALAIPRAAIVRDGLTSVFFRRDPRDPNVAIRVEADLGVDDGRWVVVKSGVAPGEEVVVAGAYELQLALANEGGAPTGGHVHADGTVHQDH